MEVLAVCASDCQSHSGVRLGRAVSAAGVAATFSLVERPLRMVRPNFRSDDSAPPFFLPLHFDGQADVSVTSIFVRNEHCCTRIMWCVNSKSNR